MPETWTPKKRDWRFFLFRLGPFCCVKQPLVFGGVSVHSYLLDIQIPTDVRCLGCDFGFNKNLDKLKCNKQQKVQIKWPPSQVLWKVLAYQTSWRWICVSQYLEMFWLTCIFVRLWSNHLVWVWWRDVPIPSEMKVVPLLESCLGWTCVVCMIFHGGSKQSTSLKLTYHLKMGGWKIIFWGPGLYSRANC